MTNLVLGTFSAMLIAVVVINVFEQMTGAKVLRVPRTVRRYAYRGRH